MNLIVVLLEMNMRQRDDLTFAALLNRIRYGEQTEQDVTTLQDRVNFKFPDDGIVPTKIMSLKKDVHQINTDNNSKLDIATKQEFNGVIFYRPYKPNDNSSQSFANTQQVSDQCLSQLTLANRKRVENIGEALKNHCCAPETVDIRVNSQVMLLKNLDVRRGLCNGSKGYVVGFDYESLRSIDEDFDVGLEDDNKINYNDDDEDDEDFVNDNAKRLLKNNNKNQTVVYNSAQANVLVKFDSCAGIVRVRKERGEWSFIDKQVGVEIVYNQMPLSLAWACTIHKSQGLTISRICVSDRAVFETGQLYTAISRVPSLHGLSFLHPISNNSFMADKEVVLFYKRLQGLETEGINNNNNNNINNNN
jgi:hypothetical protein